MAGRSGALLMDGRGGLHAADSVSCPEHDPGERALLKLFSLGLPWLSSRELG